MKNLIKPSKTNTQGGNEERGSLHVADSSNTPSQTSSTTLYESIDLVAEKVFHYFKTCSVDKIRVRNDSLRGHSTIFSQSCIHVRALTCCCHRPSIKVCGDFSGLVYPCRPRSQSPAHPSLVTLPVPCHCHLCNYRLRPVESLAMSSGKLPSVDFPVPSM